MQHALADVRVEHERAGEVGAAAVPVAQQRRRRRRDEQLRRRAEPVVDLLPGRRLEGDDELQRPARDLGRPGAGSVCAKPSAVAPAAPSGTRVSRCAADSTTTQVASAVDARRRSARPARWPAW